MSLKSMLKTFLLAIYSGLCIGVGGIVYLSSPDKVVGAFLFSLGLLTILVFGFNLYTGKVGYIVTNKPKYILEVLVVWCGNFAGTAIMGLIIRGTRVYDKIVAPCKEMVETKLNDDLLSLFILGIFCGMLMFIAVDTYKKHIEKIEFVPALLAVLCVVVFIICGFEHCIADMFYFVLADKVGACIVPLLVITLGNAVGGNLIPIGQILSKKLSDEE